MACRSRPGYAVKAVAGPTLGLGAPAAQEQPTTALAGCSSAGLCREPAVLKPAAPRPLPYPGSSPRQSSHQVQLVSSLGPAWTSHPPPPLDSRPFRHLISSESRHRRRGWRSLRSFRRRFASASQNAPSNPPHLRAQPHTRCATTCQVGAIGRVRCVVCLGAILTIDFALDMDIDDEMLALLLEDEQVFDDNLWEHLHIIASSWTWKDVERAFGVLQAQFAIVRYPALSWFHDQMWEVMQACVIMHNMIIEDDRKNHARTHVGLYECQGPLAEVNHELPGDFADFLAMHAEIRDNNVHDQLQTDLVEHLWRIKGNTVAP
ncbi:hypothetical protein QYE76_050895 [Lolium multiflorum]|uniref:Uncharacterized protein n=1 Tax=Lolium multiflorum TaxID=4521 RepID=A0AAD8SSH1_LOLMU|nr:hypothetical protein QYE76_050895 [Lolium multiflorum]